MMNKEIHLHNAGVKNLQIITTGEPSDKPFAFNEIRLPLVLGLIMPS